MIPLAAVCIPNQQHNSDACETTSHREHVRERQVSVLKKLLSQESHLPLHPCLGKMPHLWAPLPTMGVLPYLIYAREALFSNVTSPKRDMRNLCAIRVLGPEAAGQIDSGQLDAN